jgi:HTH-type transcriptional regulator / antitoxin HigA
MQVKPIRNNQDYVEALGRIEALWGASLGTEDGDLLDVLVALVEVYEREHFPIDLPDPVEALKFRLEQQGKDYRALIGIIGQRTRVYEVMRRDRPLSLAMIRNLHTMLRIPAEVLIHPGKLRRKRASEASARPKRKTA